MDDKIMDDKQSSSPASDGPRKTVDDASQPLDLKTTAISDTLPGSGITSDVSATAALPTVPITALEPQADSHPETASDSAHSVEGWEDVKIPGSNEEAAKSPAEGPLGSDGQVDSPEDGGLTEAPATAASSTPAPGEDGTTGSPDQQPEHDQVSRGKEAKIKAEDNETEGKEPEYKEPGDKETDNKETDDNETADQEAKDSQTKDSQTKDSQIKDSETETGDKKTEDQAAEATPEVEYDPNLDHDPENVDDESPSRLEWLRLKQEHGIENKVMDEVMCLIGLEEIKAEFLSAFATIEMRRKRGEDLCGNALLWTVTGYPGTGVDTVRSLMRRLETSLGMGTGYDSKWPGRVYETNLNDYSDDELHAFLKKMLKKRGLSVEGGVGGPCTRALACEVGEGRPNSGFGNINAVRDALSAACHRQAERLWKGGFIWGKAEDDEESLLFLSKEDLLGPDADALLKKYSKGEEEKKPEEDKPEEPAALPTCEDLFKEFVGFDKIIERFTELQHIATGLKLHDIDPGPYIPFTFVFKGPPGTGKTSTARKIGQIYHSMGFLDSGDVVECSTSDIVGQHLGETAQNMKSKLDDAVGKVLFIDEAYRLANGVPGKGTNRSFEDEAVGELVDALTKEQYKHKMVIILAGYSEDMNQLMKTNRGLRSRFSTDVEFPQLSPDQCIQFLGQLLAKTHISIRDRIAPAAERKEKVRRLLRKLIATKNWGNGRDVEAIAASIIRDVFKKEGKSGKKSERLQISTEELIVFLQEMLRTRLAGELEED